MHGLTAVLHFFSHSTTPSPSPHSTNSKRCLRNVLGLRQRVAVVRLEGPIGAGAGGMGGIDVTSVDAVAAAFASRPSAVFIELNSGGGSPVQSR